MTDTELRIEAFRASHEVKLVEGEQEGTLITELPPGTYGFTYAPDLEAGSPVFRRRAYRSFEIHKSADGGLHFIGYLNPDDAARVEAGDEYVEVSLYPEPFESATQPVSIGAARVVNRNPRLPRTDGNPVPLKVGPA